MLIKKSHLKNIDNKGIGLFAGENISKNDFIWIYNNIIDLIIEPNNIPVELNDFVNTYATKIKNSEQHKGKWLLYCDNARFINHSNNPNTKSLGNFKGNIAIKDILENEEITIDYTDIDSDEILFKIF